jgi:hypothetical protein
MNAQFLLSEDFTSPWNPSSTGWVIQNLSSPTSTTSWFQGNPNVFSAFNGTPPDYVGANYNSTSGSSPGTISNWLITPSVNLSNGLLVQFATRVAANPATYPDRLEVYMSTAGNGTNVGTTATSLGTFSTLLVSVNPSLTTTGYPGTWTIYTATISGLSGVTPGRIGFRYYVTNAGPSTSAVNSDYIGLDAVRIGVACAATVPSYTICSGTSATLTANGAGAGATFTWAPTAGSNSALVVNPTSTTVYTLNYSEGGNPCPAVTSTVTIGAQLSVSITAQTSNTVCTGRTVTLTANAAASTFSWSTGATAPTTTYVVNSNTSIVVGALNGNCVGTNTINLTALPNPTISATVSPTNICSGSTFTLTGTGASTYIWFNTATTGFTSNPQPLIAGAAGPRSYTLAGFGANGCGVGILVNFTVNGNPTVTASSSSPTVCTNGTVTLTGSGASTYAWSGGGTSTSNPFTFTAGATASTQNFSVIGTSTAGCKDTAAVSVSVVACPSGTTGINETSLSGTSIYPNPFTTDVHIAELNGSVEIYNALGQMVSAAVVSGSTSIKTTDLAKGIYVVKAYNSSGELVKTVKLLKN